MGFYFISIGFLIIIIAFYKKRNNKPYVNLLYISVAMQVIGAIFFLIGKGVVI